MAIDMYLEFIATGGGIIKGDSVAQGHKDAIDVLAWSWGLSNSGSADHPGKGQVQDLSLTKYVDRASDDLLGLTLTGVLLERATLYTQRAGETPSPYITITMSRVLITSISTRGSGGEDRLTENITLSFGAFEYLYYPKTSSGQTVATPERLAYDVSRGRVT